MFNYKSAIKLSIFLSIISANLLALSADEAYKNGMKYLSSLNPKKNIDDAKRAFIQARDLGHAKARLTLSILDLDLKSLTLENLVLLEEAANQDCEHAYFMLAEYYQIKKPDNGDDKDKSFCFFNKAAFAGHYKAQIILATDFMQNEDPISAIPYYEMAEKQNCFTSKAMLAKLYIESQKEKNLARAFELIKEIKNARKSHFLFDDLTKFYDDYLIFQKLKNNENAELQEKMSERLEKIFDAHEKRKKVFKLEKSQVKVSTTKTEDDSDEYSEYSKSSSIKEDQAL